MRKNIIQSGTKGSDGRSYLEHDWCGHGIPHNVELDENVYIDTSYGFKGFHSTLSPGMTMKTGSGCYDRASFIVGENGRVDIGAFSILNGSTVVCNEHIHIGDHCMFAWGSIITDSWLNNNILHEQRRSLLQLTAHDHRRMLLFGLDSNPVSISDNVWVGFDAIILPGVTLGRGCVVGSKSVISGNVPPYAVVAGNPARIIRYLSPDDTTEAKQLAFKDHLR